MTPRHLRHCHAIDNSSPGDATLIQAYVANLEYPVSTAVGAEHVADELRCPANDDAQGAVVKQPEAGKAEVIAPEVAGADFDSLPVPFSFAARIDDTKYVSQVATWGDFRAALCDPATAPTISHKDDAPVLCNELIDGANAVAINVVRWGLIYSDHDDGQSMEESARIAREHGEARVILPTASYGKTEIEITHDDYVRHAPGLGLPVEFTEQSGRDYFERKKVLIPDFAQAAKYLGRFQVPKKGFVHRFETKPIPKHRTIGPVAEVITIGDYVVDGVPTKTVTDAAADAYKAIHDKRGGTYDASCSDLSRRIYRYSIVKGKELPKPIYVEGQPTDIKTPFEKALEARKSGQKLSAKAGKAFQRARTDSSKVFIHEGFNLKAWAAQYGKTYSIEALMERAGRVLGDRPNGGTFIGCHESHSGGVSETFCANGDGEKGFVIHCSGHTGGCHDKDRLDHLMDFLAAKIITIDDLKDESLGGGEISNRVIRDGARKRRGKTVVVDSNGWGLDATKFLKGSSGKIDYAKLQTDRKGVSIGPGMTAEDIVTHINNGVFSVRDILLATMSPPNVSTYDGALRALVLTALVAQMRQSQIDESFLKISEVHNVKLGSIKQDYKDEFKRLEEDFWSLGKLSDTEAQSLRGKYDYTSRFAILNTGGKAMVLDMHQPDLSKAVHTHEDFTKLYSDDYIIVDTEKGPKPHRLANEWLSLPPPDASFFRSGMVFKPPLDMATGHVSNVSADTYNLWSGYLVEPDPSGSCEMLYRLFDEVWCRGDKALTEWVKEWFWHIFRFPGKPCGTALGIHGEQGDGKSIVTEVLLQALLGEMLFSTANAGLVTGSFNELLVGKLLMVLPEAQFAGDKAAFAKLKDIVTAPTIAINPKHKAPMTLDNYARVLFTSNRDHFLDIECGDRRYVALRSSPCWKGTQNFQALVDEWNAGGAARFLHDALNHEFRRIEGTGKLVVSTKIRTEFETVQESESRELVQKFAVEFLLRGDFSAATGQTADFVAHEEVWKLDEGYETTLTDLHDAYVEFLRRHAPSKVQHADGKTTLLRAFENLCGEIEEVRETVGRHDHGPRKKVLPPRAEALRHARENGQITALEFEEVNLPEL